MRLSPDDQAPPPGPTLAAALAQLTLQERVALLQHLDAAMNHTGDVAERLLAASGDPAPTVREVEARVCAAIRRLEAVLLLLECEPPVGGPARAATEQRNDFAIEAVPRPAPSAAAAESRGAD